LVSRDRAVIHFGRRRSMFLFGFILGAMATVMIAVLVDA
jgi:hypothetical protein